MKALVWINFALLVVLSVSTGIVKIAGLEADIEIFARLGFSPAMTVAFGVVQALAGLALLPGRTRRTAALVLAASFVIATVGLFVSGIHPFASISVVFIVMAGVVATGHPKTGNRG
ncbi:MAG: hypothetical protein K0V04_12560 [Deltaproteobacteria bacterium]|nr:hypothetical protein [Deltaproteobacteria bacterium]